MCGEDCAPFVRAGSILSGPMQRPLLPPEGYVDEQVPEDERIAQIQVDDQRASPIIASVKDKKAEEATEEGPTPAVEEGPTLAVEEGPTLAVEEGPTLAVEEGPTLAIEFEEQPSEGWKAAKRRSETVRE
jgi:hypothetical protein